MSKPFSFSASLDDYKSRIWHGQSIFSRYALIRNYLRSHLTDEIAELLAEPVISDAAVKGKVKAKWISKQFTADGAVQYTELSDHQRAAIDQKLSGYFQVLSEYVARLQQSTDSEERNWAELIDLAFQFPDTSHLWTENGKVVLTVWGFGFADDMEPAINLKNMLKTLPEASAVPPVIIQSSQPEDTPLPAEEISDPEEKRVNDPVIQKETPTDEPPPDNGDGDEGKKFNRNWLWLLLLLLIPLIWWLLSDRDRVLPPEPGVIPPIDTTKIVSDPDSILTILSNRLNVALTGQNKDLQEFGSAFKKAYPEDSYKIVYYDTLTYRLQLEIPESAREQVKAELKSKLSQFDMLIWYEKVYDYQAKPRDPGFQNPAASWYHEDIKTYKAWERSTGDSDLVVAVVDDGFDLNHPELQGKIYKPRNIPERSDDVNTGYNSRHGTHVAGIAIGLANNGVGLAGVAPGCQFMPVQVGDYYGRLSSTAIVDGILYAIHNGADVINVSLGMKPDPRIAQLPDHRQQEMIDNTFKQEEAFWESVFEIARDKNVMVVLAAGNDNVLIGLDPMLRSRLTVNVSASDAGHKKADFSNYGELSTLSAPGVAIYSSLPNAQFDYRDGTSMAAPVVAGSMALIKSINSTYTNAQLIELLQKTGIPVVRGNGTEKKMGNIIQLDQAFRFAEEDKNPDYQVSCPSVQDQIDSLLLLVEKLRQQCPVAGTDTLKLPVQGNEDDMRFALGRWKSTTKIINVNTEEELEVWFDFYADGSGRLQLIEPGGVVCTAPLSVELKSSALNMEQLQAAVCDSGTEYTAYNFTCSPDASGRAACFARSKKDASNAFEFNLVRTHNVLN